MQLNLPGGKYLFMKFKKPGDVIKKRVPTISQINEPGDTYLALESRIPKSRYVGFFESKTEWIS